MIDRIYLKTEPNNQQNQPRISNVAYDKELVKYINSLSDSIKNFYKFSKNNINETFRFLNSSKFVNGQEIIILNQMMNMNNQERVNELFQKLEMHDINIKKIEENLNSNTEKITLFFNDAKYLVKLIKDLRNKYLNESNFNKNKRTDSPYLKNKIDISDNISNKLNLFNNNKKQLNSICNEILTTTKNFGKNLINPFDIQKHYDEMAKNIKINIDKIISMSASPRTKICRTNSLINQPVSANIIFNRFKSPSINNKLKYLYEKENKNCKSYEIQINELQGQVKKFKQKIKFLENKLQTNRENCDININNNLNRIIVTSSNRNKNVRRSENRPSYSPSLQINLNNLNNNNSNINNQILLKKENEIMQYKNKLNVYQKKINILVAELNKIKKENFEKQNMIQNKGQYEEIIKELHEETLNYKNIISMNQNRIIKYENQIRELKSGRNSLSNKNNIDNDKYKLNSYNNIDTINKLQRELQLKNNQILKMSNQIKIIENNRNKLNIQNNLKIQNFNRIDVAQLFQESNILKQDLLKFIDFKDIETNFDVLIKENKEFKKLFEELQDKFIKTKIFYEENLKNLKNNCQNKDLINENTKSERDKLIKELKDSKKNNNNEFKITNHTNDNYELIKKINELSSTLEIIQDSKNKLEIEIKKKNEELEGLKIFIQKLQNEREKNDDNKNRFHDNFDSSKNDKENGIPIEKFIKIVNKLNDAEKQIEILQKSNRDLINKLEIKETQNPVAFRTEDFCFSNFEEEVEYKKMLDDKNTSKNININYSDVQEIKEKQNQLLEKMKMLEEQIKILLYNINCSGKIKPIVAQICQLLGLDNQKIQMIISGKNKKNALGIIS